MGFEKKTIPYQGTKGDILFFAILNPLSELSFLFLPMFFFPFIICLSHAANYNVIQAAIAGQETAIELTDQTQVSCLVAKLLDIPAPAAATAVTE